MRIIVCIKQVPNPDKVRFDEKTGTLIREGVESQINPYDLNALEEALKLKDSIGAEVITLTMGPPQAEEALRQTISMGADSAILISDKKFAGSDTLATTYVLSKAIKTLGNFDIILCGKQSVDGDTAQVGPGLATRLNIPFVTYVHRITPENDYFILERTLDKVYRIRISPPFLATITDRANTPRLETLRGKLKAKSAQIPVWNAATLFCEDDKIGLLGSPTRVSGSYVPQKTTEKNIVEGTTEEKVDFVIRLLKDKGLL